MVYQWRTGIFNHLETGEYQNSKFFDKDWEERPLAINRGTDGIIHLASIPSGKGGDFMMGSRFEIILYPDGHYFLSTLASWIGEGKTQREARPTKVKSGCNHHTDCLTCPYADCIKK